MTSIFKKVAFAAAMVAGSFASHAGSVGQPVTIQESAIPGAFPNQIVVDQLGGFYDEVLTVTPINASSGTFATSAIFDATSWTPHDVGPNASPFQQQLGPGFGANTYAVYVKFVGAGSYASAGGGFTFTGGTGAMELWADPSRDTNYNVASTTTGLISDLVLASGAASIGDDFMLGSATSTSVNAGGAAPGVANGNFEIIFDNFSLTAAGEQYFIAPRPFYMLLDLNGNFQSFNPNSVNDVQIIGSVANGFFMANAVPEPGALALVGLAMLGAGVASRRRK